MFFFSLSADLIVTFQNIQLTRPVGFKICTTKNIKQVNDCEYYAKTTLSLKTVTKCFGPQAEDNHLEIHPNLKILYGKLTNKQLPHLTFGISNHNHLVPGVHEKVEHT